MVDGNRSKRITNLTSRLSDISELPEWNYDGSSTGQAETGSSEVILKPVKFVSDPFRITNDSFLVLCETFHANKVPLESNSRHNARKIFDKESDHKEPMFGRTRIFYFKKNRTACSSFFP